MADLAPPLAPSRLQAPRLRRAAAERRPLAVRAEGSSNGAGYVEEQSFRIERVRRCCC